MLYADNYRGLIPLGVVHQAAKHFPHKPMERAMQCGFSG